MIITDNEVTTNSLQAWILAARPKTLTGALVPVMIGLSLAYKDGGPHYFQVAPAILCFLFASLMQINSNLINDYFDFKHGNDDKAIRLGPKRACAEGWITLPAMRMGLFWTCSLTCIIGLPLIRYGGLPMIIVGACCLLFAFLYTTFFSYRGMGDILVLLFFGIVPVCFTRYVILPESLQDFNLETFAISVGCGLVIDTLLCVNNFRDRDNDIHDNKYTLIVRLGEKRGLQLYWLTGFLGFQISVIIIAINGFLSQKFILTIIAISTMTVYLFLHNKTYEKMKQIFRGRELNKILAQTSVNMFLYGLTTSLGIILISL